MKQHLGRQSGVQKVEVSLIDGKVEVTPKEDGQIDPAQLLKATYDSGVTVAEMDMTAQGKIVKDSSGNLAFRSHRIGHFAFAPTNCRKDSNPSRARQRWSLCVVSCARSRREKKETFGSPEAADSRSAEEGIDAETTSVISEPRCGRTRRMRSAFGESYHSRKQL